MTDLRPLLQEGDPILHEGEIGKDDARRIRTHVLSLSDHAQRGTNRVLTAALATGLLAAVVAAGWFVRPADIDTDVVPPIAMRSQLQISTPGGTRVIWFFNSELDVR